MKTISKVLLIVFFFVFLFLNNRIIFDDFIHNDYLFIKRYHYNIESIKNEAFIILPLNLSENSEISCAGNSNFTLSLNNSFFIKKNYITENKNSLAHLYKTENFPNAP